MTGWNEHGHAVATGLPIDRYLGAGDLQDAENCGYAPTSVLAEMGVDAVHGDAQIQFRDGRIVLLDGTVLERGGTLNCVWAVTRLPRYTEADVDRLAQVIDNAREAGIHHGNYTLARWILDRWPVEETGRRWVFPLDSKADVVMPNGVHVYWSTHCRHGNHADCKGSCKICGSPCLCAGCTHETVETSAAVEGADEELRALVTDAIAVGDVARRYARLYGAEANTVHAAVEAALHVLDHRQPVEGSTPIASPAPADEPVPVPPPVDALLKLVDKFGDARHDVGSWGALDLAEKEYAAAEAVAVSTAAAVNAAVTALWAAGVEEGHGLLDRAVVQEIEQRERAEEIVDKLTAAIGRHLGEDFGEHSNLNDPWGRALVALAEADAGGKFVGGAYERGIFDEGIREGRRQATEERELAAAVAEAKAAERRKLMRYPSDRPGWLGSGQPWPCGRCGVEVDDDDPHACRTAEEAAILPADESPAVDHD